MRTRRGRSRLVSGQDLGVLLHDHDPLRLVVLNSCEGARADPSDPFTGTAQTLIQQGIPAVVAMQFEITDSAAITFANELYAAVADSYPLDAALAEARKAIWADGNQVEWATPVLHLRAPDGRIFDVTASTATASARFTSPSTPPASEVLSPNRRTETNTEPTATAGMAETTTPVGTHPDTGWSSTQVSVMQHRSKGGLQSKIVFGVAFSLDGRWLASCSDDQTAVIWDVRTGQKLHTFDHKNSVRAVAFSPDGRWLATGSDDGTARIWNAHSSMQQDMFSHNNWVRAVAFSPDGRWLATGCDDSGARIWDTYRGQQRHTFHHEDWVRAVAFSPDGRWLATSSADNTARILDARGDEQLHTLRYDTALFPVAFSPDGRLLATGIRGNRAVLWMLTPPSH